MNKQSVVGFLYNPLFLIVLLCFVSFFLRTYKIDQLTPGAYGDEITIAQTSNTILSQRITPFVAINYGHPTPLLYLQGFIQRELGVSLLTIRLVSVITGTLTVGVIFLLISRIFNAKLGLVAAWLLAFSYPHLVISRLDYEVAPAILFQMLSYFFGYTAYKNNQLKYFLATGVALGLGMYTYLGFRTFLLIFLLIFIFSIRKKNSDWIKKCSYTVGVFLLISLPLLIFSIRSPEIVMARTNSLSIFNQGLAFKEVFKELSGNIFYVSHLFIFTGDPNFRQNPSRASFFDPVTIVVAIFGMRYLYIKKRTLFFFSCFFLLPAIANDVFTLEKIPEFHYYGLGHPNTLRIAGILPIIFLWFAAGLLEIKKLLERFIKSFSSEIFLSLIIFVLLATAVINSYNYFGQTSQPIAFGYNYILNEAAKIELTKSLKTYSVETIFVPVSYSTDPKITLFLENKFILKELSVQSISDISNLLTDETAVVIDVKQSQRFIIEITSSSQELPFKIHTLKNIADQPEYLILTTK